MIDYISVRDVYDEDNELLLEKDDILEIDDIFYNSNIIVQILIDAKTLIKYSDYIFNMRKKKLKRILEH